MPRFALVELGERLASPVAEFDLQQFVGRVNLDTGAACKRLGSFTTALYRTGKDPSDSFLIQSVCKSLGLSAASRIEVDTSLPPRNCAAQRKIVFAVTDEVQPGHYRLFLTTLELK